MSKKILLVLFVSLALHCDAQQKKYVLWYNQPAKDWNEALPLGNGRIGAMVFGRTDTELIQLNEQTLWTGGPVDHDPNPGAPAFLQPVRNALFKDSISQAVGLLKKMQGPNTEMYQPLGDIVIHQAYTGTASDYRRELDISQAIASTSFTANGVMYKREMFTSAPDQLFIIRLTASRLKTLNLTVDVQHELKFARTVSPDKQLILSGKARITNDERRNPKPLIYEDAENCDGMRFQFRIKAILKDGQLTSTDTSLVISNASEVILLVSAATSFNGYDKCPVKDGKDENALAASYIQKAVNKKYPAMLASHKRDYRNYFDRMVLSLTNDTVPVSATDLRLAAYKNGSTDPSLEEMYFQYGRYLLISSSRPGGLPANLQGIWNHLTRPSWRSNYTTNINLQMNYWLAEACNLREISEPLIAHIQKLAINGTYTAKNYYRMRGWAVHHNSDMWAQTNPVGEGNGDPKWANWSLGSPWLSQHLYEHYRFSTDQHYLRQVAYPLMKTAAEFCLDWLVEKDGKLLTAPSTSPENVYLHPNGFKGTVTIASAMDMEIIWDLFTNLIEASDILKMDTAFANLLRKKRDQLHPLKIGRKGNLVEWYDDWEDEDPLHRHVSHLFGLHPGRQLSPLLDSSLANASRKTLELRGDGGTGWSKAWKINFWARLLDGDHAYKMYQELLRTSTLNNLFDTHPPFQIDGNFGATAGIAEMLLQSHLTEIQLLPALPGGWKNGYVNGIVARGNFEVDMRWENGLLTASSILSRSGNVCTLRTNQKIDVDVKGFTQRSEIVEGKIQFVSSFKTVKGKRYFLSFAKRPPARPSKR